MEENEDNKKTPFELIDILQTTELFSEIHDEVAEALLKRLKHIKLAKDEILFEEGSLSDAFYILIEGHLIAYLKTSDGKEKIIGGIEKGETVGEMGALSNQPRSLTVRATLASELLKLEREEFETFSKEYPQLLLNITRYVIKRSQNTLKLISEKKIYKHIAIIQGNDQTPIMYFLEMLRKHIHSHHDIIIHDPSQPILDLSKEINRAEKEGKTLFFSLTPQNFKNLQKKLTHLSAIYIVVDGDGPPKFSEFALDMAKGHHHSFITDVKLILIHSNKIEIPKGTIHWLTQAKFTTHHHLRLHDHEGYKQLIRFMTGKPFAVVLGGGGGKGWASVGALKAIINSDAPIDAIGGTSVGALIGACYAKHLKYQPLLEDFKKLSEAADKPFSWYNFTWPIISLLSSKRPTELLQRTFSDIQIEDLWIPFFSISTNLNTGKEIVHQTGALWECLRASMALPGIVPPVVIDGQLFVDGGLMNNLPVDVMRNLLGKEAMIIAVSLSKLGEDKRRYCFPPIIPFHVGLFKKLGFGYKDYIFPPFFNTFLVSLLVGSSSREKTNKLLANVSVTPDLSSYRTLKIDISQYNKILDIGYISTREILKNELPAYLSEIDTKPKEK